MFATTSNESQPTTTSSSSSFVERSLFYRHFDYPEILSATQNFDESLVVGRGGFGKVYKGNIYKGSTLVTVAIKRLDDMSSQGASEFWAEIEMLSKLRHCHLVALIGYCNFEREMILVYEYIPNGTLGDHLHKLNTRLSWCQRLNICIGAARVLDYLHTGMRIEFGIIHRDVKSSNILLDESWAAKVSDFGLSKLCSRKQASTHVSTLVKGTFGYFDPYYYNTGQLTRKSDVYAFGVVLLEVLCRKRAVDRSLDYGLATWAQYSIKEGRLKDIVDPDIRGEIFTKCLKQFAQIIERCLDNHPKNRPTMAEVVLNLELVLNLQEKTDNLLHTRDKTIFGRMVEKFSFTENDQNSGVDSGSLVAKKTHRGMNTGPLMSKKKNALVQKVGQILKGKLEKGIGSIKVFQVEELQIATMNFAESMVLGTGSVGVMYKGKLPDHREVAIKRFERTSNEGYEQFVNEIEVLGQISHRHVVRLFGCAYDNEVLLLAYEFFPYGTLDEYIHNYTSTRGRFSWDERLRIAHELATALAYLHSDAPVTIIHRDLKANNILFDDRYSTKISGFGVSKLRSSCDDEVLTKVVGTRGYLDPEYLDTGHLTDKCDVYSFGVILAELLTGIEPVDSPRYYEDRNLANYFVRLKSENRLHELVDDQVLEEASDSQLEVASILVCRCLHKEGRNRPSMKEVKMELESLRQLLVHPDEMSQDNNNDMIESEFSFLSNSSSVRYGEYKTTGTQ